MKNLAILFCSFRPAGVPERVADGREQEYLICVRHLLNVIPLDSFDVVVAENTVSNIDGIRSKELRELLSTDARIKDVFLFEENLGEHGNKGLGELQMLKGVMDSIEPNSYKNVSYVTARRIYANPYVFEKTEMMTKEALISNPDFLYLTGKYLESEKRAMYNDMFFSMTEKRMREYADFSMENMQNNALHHIGSEQNLYRFIHQKKIEFEMLKWLGVIRNDWMLDFNQANINNIHVC